MPNLAWARMIRNDITFLTIPLGVIYRFQHSRDACNTEKIFVSIISKAFVSLFFIKNRRNVSLLVIVVGGLWTHGQMGIATKG